MIDADACACLHFLAVDSFPFVGRANDLVNVVMAELLVRLKAGLEVMDLIAGFDLVAEIEQSALTVVALTFLVVLVVPLHLVGCVAFDSYL